MLQIRTYSEPGVARSKGPYQILGMTHSKGLSESWEWPIPRALPNYGNNTVEGP
jgi:hypothetical protein